MRIVYVLFSVGLSFSKKVFLSFEYGLKFNCRLLFTFYIFGCVHSYSCACVGFFLCGCIVYDLFSMSLNFLRFSFI